MTLDDAPLATGTVVFYPTAPGPASYGKIDTAGNYAIVTGIQQGLTPGDYVATVVATELPGKGETFGKLLTPSRYGDAKQSDLRFTVQPGANRIDLRLRRH